MSRNVKLTRRGAAIRVRGLWMTCRLWGSIPRQKRRAHAVRALQNTMSFATIGLVTVPSRPFVRPKTHTCRPLAGSYASS